MHAEVTYDLRTMAYYKMICVMIQIFWEATRKMICVGIGLVLFCNIDAVTKLLYFDQAFSTD